VSVLAVALGGLALAPQHTAHANVVATQTFADATAPGWVLGGSAILTSGGADPAGSGWLRLTDDGPTAEVGSAYLSTAFSSAAGVRLSFDYTSWGGGGADGSSFFLWDGSIPFSVGQSGGSLGYANGCGTPGVNAGYVGIGLDEYGNDANAFDNCHNGGDGVTFQPFNQQVGIRGSALNGYAWLTGSGLLSQSLSFPFTTARPDQAGPNFRHVTMTITPGGLLTVQVQLGAGSAPATLINNYNLAAQGAPPSTYKLGFVGSTGAVSAMHEVKNLTLSDFEGTAASGSSIWLTEPAGFSGAVASVSVLDPTATAGQFSASINWGDGTAVTPGMVAGPTGGPFTVTGTHSYPGEGNFNAVASIIENDVNSIVATATDPVSVADAPLTATAVPNIASTKLTLTNMPLATFTDGNPAATPSDFSASVNWGDASTSAGVISGPVGGTFTVTGSHAYTAIGPKAIQVTITDDGGATAVANTQDLLYAYSGRGDFVIGDKNSATGSPVQFWGAQWSSKNSLSRFAFPGNFNGFEGPVTAPRCGTGWLNLAGRPNSAMPPATVPSYMAVIVSSSVLKFGPIAIGYIAHVVVVKTDPGYAADPSHAGTGTVVGTIC
jgi:hypothetical protein